ncbi:MAG: hypothetical protein OEL75_04475, partial [Kiritimatiellaceae bacterium]|nr:hypothetical protein [Kiritimatiellaceae bacterium]
MYKQQKSLTLSTMALHRQLLRERLQILINTSETFAKQIDQRNRLVQPLLKQLEADLNQIEGGPLEQMRDWMSIR